MIEYGESKYPENNVNNIKFIIRFILITILVLFVIKLLIKHKRRLVIIIGICIISISVLSFFLLLHIYNDAITAKPIIYIYPTEETELTVKLKNVKNITCSYPNYPSGGWRVFAKPNGDLTYIENERNLYSLYYESTNAVKFKVEKDGFIVKGSEVSEFLEDKLEILGLTEREAEEFIVYWLPKLETDKFNYIRFATMDEINKNMPLEFSKEPDTLIRVLMTYKGLNKPIEVEEQELKTPERAGFVAVEWGGSEIK